MHSSVGLVGALRRPVPSCSPGSSPVRRIVVRNGDEENRLIRREGKHSMSQQPRTVHPHSSKPRLRAALVALAIIGCVISGILLNLGAPSRASGSAFGANFCTPSDRVNCDYVLSSRWARIGPVPTAAVGVGYFATLAVWFLVIGVPNRAGRLWHLFPSIFTTVGMCGSAWFVFVMAARLPVWCTWCVAGHSVNALLFIMTLVSWPRAVAATPPDQPPYPTSMRAVSVLVGSVALVLILLLIGFAHRSQMIARTFQLQSLEATNNIEYVTWRHAQSPLQDIPLRDDEVGFGKPDAPFTLVVFSDFECAHCWEFHLNAVRLVSQFPETLRLVCKHFPASAQCNPYVGSGLHYFACDAAFAAEAARAAGSAKQWHEYLELLYRNRERFDESPYDELARRVGLDEGAFSAAMASEEVRRRVRDDIDLAHRLGVERTPGVFLNGRALANWRITTTDPEPKLDVEKTLALWERLLGEKAAIHRPSPPDHGS